MRRLIDELEHLFAHLESLTPRQFREVMLGLIVAAVLWVWLVAFITYMVWSYILFIGA